MIYFFKFVIEGTTTQQFDAVKAKSTNDAKKIIEARNGKVARYLQSQSFTESLVKRRGPPPWYKGPMPR